MDKALNKKRLEALRSKEGLKRREFYEDLISIQQRRTKKKIKELTDFIFTLFEGIDKQMRALIERLIESGIVEVEELNSQLLVASLGDFKIKVVRSNKEFEFFVYIKESPLDVFKITAKAISIYYPNIVPPIGSGMYKRINIGKQKPIIDVEYKEAESKVIFYFKEGVLKEKLPPIHSNYGSIEFKIKNTALPF
ncbi:MAG: hypothetical protein AMJ45_04675 [Syntrophobacter sp. DG_60]|nr:MAG: hypothetical protein AMJ45_04675 [Syntrophobacter sp. DG_60]